MNRQQHFSPYLNKHLKMTANLRTYFFLVLEGPGTFANLLTKEWFKLP